MLLGALTFFAWLQNRAIRALAWWSGAVLDVTPANLLIPSPKQARRAMKRAAA
ncbi:hypothetical protein [Bradyrhizobium sp. sGM-13]|uniref:hypothetical protein n=1 Tax=Bradyrhizobium sp. sGM-13 TaxID=2831781 RepID=UPI001BCEAACD|nr:hypothetical protein [Bradyrhizobium sp. sGM-13]